MIPPELKRAVQSMQLGDDTSSLLRSLSQISSIQFSYSKLRLSLCIDYSSKIPCPVGVLKNVPLLV